MSRRGALALVVIAAAGVAGGLALASRGGDKRVVSYCRADPRPLPGDIPASIGSIKAGARKVLRREARDPSSSFARVLAGSPYTVVEEGYISSGDHGWHGRQDKVIGAIFDVRVEDPRPFDAIVPAYRYPPQG